MSEDQLEQPVTTTKFSWLRIGKIILIIILAAVFAGGIWFAVISRPVKAAWASLVHNRRENYLTCEQLPFFPQVDKAFNEHRDIVNKVKAVPGVLDFKPELDSCYIFSGGTEFLKGQAALEYNSRAARTQAEKIIGKDFFGIPYHGEPVK